MNKINQRSNNLSTEEIHRRMIKAQEAKIEKDYRRKLFILRHQQKFFRYSRLIGLIALGVLFAVAIVFWLIKLVSNIWENRDKQENSVSVEYKETPPAGFGVKVEEMKIIQPVVGETTYDVVAKITNQDNDWGVSQLQYKFVLKDRFDKVVLEKERTSYILPSQQRHLIEVGLRAERAVVGGSLEIKMLEVQKLKEFIIPDIQVTSRNYRVVDQKSKVLGEIVNNNPYGFEKVDIGVILYDTSGKIIGLNFTNVNSLSAHAKRDFVATWSEEISEEVDKIYIEPTVNAFQSELFMKDYGSGNRWEY